MTLNSSGYNCDFWFGEICALTILFHIKLTEQNQPFTEMNKSTEKRLNGPDLGLGQVNKLGRGTKKTIAVAVVFFLATHGEGIETCNGWAHLGCMQVDGGD